MPFVRPQFSKNEVNRAGEILARPKDFPLADQVWASVVLTNWRACHGYPINTFQATLRAKLKNGYGKAIVAQRLKRAPSIILKLQRFDRMRLARMQDIGGLRAVLSSLSRVRRLEKDYKATKFEHELKNSKDYIAVCAHHSHPFPCRVTGEQSLAAATSATPFAGPGGPSSHRHGPPAPLRGTCARPLDGPAARRRAAGPRSRSLRRGADRAHP